MSFGRNFRMGKEGRYNLQVRAEFQNIFNRLFLSAPATGNTGGNPFTGPITTATAPTTANGVYTAGYGYINTTNPLGGAAQPRSGQLVGRFTF
jgi:hypothetical protein